MKKKYIIAGAVCIGLLLSGICYSRVYYGKDPSAALVEDLSEEALKEETSASGAAGLKEAEVSKAAGNSNAPAVVSEAGSSEADPEATEEASKTKIYVHVCGAVVNPGVYQAKDGARVFDLIEMAGGLSKEAAGDSVNQAQQVTDGQRIYIPTREEIEDIPAQEYITEGLDTEKDNGREPELININTADAEQLMELPGIGEAKALSIIEYRTANGSFQVIEDLMKISGIKEGLFNKLSGYISVR